jgi:hypothetical protein
MISAVPAMQPNTSRAGWSVGTSFATGTPFLVMRTGSRRRLTSSITRRQRALNSPAGMVLMGASICPWSYDSDHTDQRQRELPPIQNDPLTAPTRAEVGARSPSHSIIWVAPRRMDCGIVHQPPGTGLELERDRPPSGAPLRAAASPPQSSTGEVPKASKRRSSSGQMAPSGQSNRLSWRRAPTSVSKSGPPRNRSTWSAIGRSWCVT